jgi:hypothetical protein
LARGKPGKIHLQIIRLMKRFPDGITSGQIRQQLEKAGLAPEEHTHLDRRKRDLKKWFEIEKVTARRPDANGKLKSVFLYRYAGEREEDLETSPISSRIRAQILHAAHGRCQMCGRTISRHHITLVIDHKKPKDWGGTNDPVNLWAICEECNGGKKAFFSSVAVDCDLMKRILDEKSVHVRIGETLKAFGLGTPVPAYLLELVADDQEDWQRRLRELRSPVIGWDYSYRKFRESGRVKTDYTLTKFEPWPEDPAGAIRKYERRRAKKTAAKRLKSKP